MNKNELENEIIKTQKQLEALQNKLKETEDEVPDTLDINENDEYCYVNDMGNIIWTSYTHISVSDDDRCVRNHRAFLSEGYAEAFAKKTQFIADMLHFKYLYDRDYEPNWDSEVELKYCVYYNAKTKQFEWSFRTAYAFFESVYFSTPELAEKCVKWLNAKLLNNSISKEHN